jgi:hypothetical protein
MLAIDGAQHSGCGTIVRYAVALAALVGTTVQVSARPASAFFAEGSQVALSRGVALPTTRQV